MSNKVIKDKKPTQLKLSSMSVNYTGNPPTKSGKHWSQEVTEIKRRERKRNKSKTKPPTTP
jgi:hypothetical protein